MVLAGGGEPRTLNLYSRKVAKKPERHCARPELSITAVDLNEIIEKFCILKFLCKVENI